MRLFGLMNICCLNPGIQTKEEGAIIITSNPTVFGYNVFKNLYEDTS